MPCKTKNPDNAMTCMTVVNGEATAIAQEDFNPRVEQPPWYMRDYYSTNQSAEYLDIRPQTMRKSYSINGEYLGVVPKKAANGRLYWKGSSIRALIEH